jgi:hypothetical protein
MSTLIGSRASAASSSVRIWIASVCFGVAAAFCRDADFTLDFAEAAALNLARRIWMKNPARGFLGDDALWAAHVHALEKLVWAAARRPREFMRVNDIDFGRALRCFESVLFARLYGTFDEIVELWDQILARLPIPGRFFSCLTVAHFRLWLDPPETILTPNGVEANFLGPGNHAVGQVIEEAMRLMDHKRSQREASCKEACPCVPRWHGYEIPENAG